MPELSLLVLLILLLAVLLLLSLLAVAVYSGLLVEVAVRSGPPPVRALTLAYKYKQGPYREAACVFTESTSIGPKLSCIGVYYDDPQQVRRRCLQLGLMRLPVCARDVIAAPSGLSEPKILLQSSAVRSLV